MSKRRIARLPVRIYQSENQFALAAPLAGLEPGDITVTIKGKRVTIQGKERGPHQHDLDLLKAEWTIGPYHRNITLPQNVDGALANATYGNGVLVLTLPKARSIGKPIRTEFTLETIKPIRGERIGHTGHDIREMTKTDHLDRLSQRPKRVVI